MKIEYTEQPLDYIVTLSDTEKELLKLKIRLELYEDYFFDIGYHLENDKKIDLNYIKNKVDENLIDFRVNQLFDIYVNNLMLGHAGDCTSIPCSCAKCHAETLLDIKSPLSELNNSEMFKLQTAQIKNISKIDDIIFYFENQLKEKNSERDKGEYIHLIKFLGLWKKTINL